ncbi:hypothetical protein ACRRTK_017725 [Alexandromys fortis]
MMYVHAPATACASQVPTSAFYEGSRNENSGLPDAVIPGSTQGHRQEMLEGTAALKVSLCPQQQRVC